MVNIHVNALLALLTAECLERLKISLKSGCFSFLSDILIQSIRCWGESSVL